MSTVTSDAPAADAKSAEELREAAAHGLRWSAIARPATEVIQLGSVLILARLIAPAEFGRVAIALIAQEVAYLIVSGGLERRPRPAQDGRAASTCRAGLALALLAGFAAGPGDARGRQPDRHAGVRRAYRLLRTADGAAVPGVGDRDRADGDPAAQDGLPAPERRGSHRHLRAGGRLCRTRAVRPGRRGARPGGARRSRDLGHDHVVQRPAPAAPPVPPRRPRAAELRTAGVAGDRQLGRVQQHRLRHHRRAPGGLPDRHLLPRLHRRGRIPEQARDGDGLGRVPGALAGLQPRGAHAAVPAHGRLADDGPVPAAGAARDLGPGGDPVLLRATLG